jgi:gluconolactonase
MSMDVEILGEGLQLPEGPVALADGSVLVCEVIAGTIARVEADGRVERIASPGGGPNGAAIGPDGALWLCNNGGGYVIEAHDDGSRVLRDPARSIGGCIQRVDLASGKTETIFTHSGARRLVGPNDLVFDRDGGLWFTDYGDFTADGRRYGAIHYAPPGAEQSRCVRGGLISPNGIGLSPDGSVVYVADTFTARLWAFDIVGAGEVAPEPGPYQPGRLVQTLPGFRLLDSLALEAGGKVCVGALYPGGVAVFDPDGGADILPAPDERITNLCFGGGDMRDVWLTAASRGCLLKTRWPRAGLKLNFNG